MSRIFFITKIEIVTIRWITCQNSMCIMAFCCLNRLYVCGLIQEWFDDVIIVRLSKFYFHHSVESTKNHLNSTRNIRMIKFHGKKIMVKVSIKMVKMCVPLCLFLFEFWSFIVSSSSLNFATEKLFFFSSLFSSQKD